MVSSSCKQGGVWRSLVIDDKVHVVCFTKEKESWKVVLTDLIEIWVENLTDKIVFHKCQTLNPLLKPLEAFDWKQKLMDMLNDIPQYIVEASVSQIKLRKDLGFVKLKFSLDFIQGTPKELWENVTMPLCLSSMEIVRQHEILLDLVKKKDDEIAEYKAGGAKLIRKYIATKPFSEETFQTDTTVPVATDFIRAFQSILNSCNTVTLPKTHIESEPSNGAREEKDDVPRINRSEHASLIKDEHVQDTRQDEPNNENVKSDEIKHETNRPTGGSSILKLGSTSYSIQKSLKKKKKTLSDLIL